MQGIEVAFYVVHSMAGGHDFEQRNVLAARNVLLASSESSTLAI